MVALAGARMSSRPETTPTCSGLSWCSLLVLSLLSPARGLSAVTPLDVATSGLASMARMPFAAGSSTTVVEDLAPLAPASSLPRLYEFEACPFCRRTREAITALDLEVEIYPCGQGSRHRAAATSAGGKAQFPLLVDGDEVLYESEDIVAYLAKKRGVDPAAVADAGGAAASLVASALRFGRGAAVADAARGRAAPAKLLELYSYDGNQFCRLVREVLCELDLPYVLRSAGKGSPRRGVLEDLAGSSQCPYLVDPNTGAALAESADIVDYLLSTYGGESAAEAPSPKDELVALCRAGKSGEKKDPERFDELLRRLEESNPTPEPARSPLFSGTWDLLWTTESELNFAMDKGLFAAGPCVGCEQTISIDDGSLKNVVLFDNDSKLSVGSSIAVDETDPSGRRFNFEFDSCFLQWRGTKVPLPPVGKGWGDLLYLDATLRLQKDIRGDLLIATKRESA